LTPPPRDALEGGEVSPRLPGRPAYAKPQSPTASFNGICNRQEPPPTALATTSNRQSKRFRGRLSGHFPSNVPLPPSPPPAPPPTGGWGCTGGGGGGGMRTSALTFRLGRAGARAKDSSPLDRKGNVECSYRTWKGGCKPSMNVTGLLQSRKFRKTTVAGN
jgi:hypothetical protein